MSSSEVFSIDTNRQPWERRELAEIDASFLTKLLVADSETGMRVVKVRYEAGFMAQLRTRDVRAGGCSRHISR
jgi:hypothetical protein